MSNPAVIVLATNDDTGGRFVIEDNIGESIHLHYDCFRLDLTVKEFLELEPIIESCLEGVINVPGFKVCNFDPLFLDSISKFLPDLEKVALEDVDISTLVIQRNGIFGLPFLTSVYNSRVIRALNGRVGENNAYFQINRFGVTNQQRAEGINQIIKEKGYPYDGKYIVLFNKQSIIRDGQHRASALIYNGFSGTIPVIRLYFKNDRHSSEKYPWVRFIIMAILSKLRRIVGRVFSAIKSNLAIY